MWKFTLALLFVACVRQPAAPPSSPRAVDARAVIEAFIVEHKETEKCIERPALRGELTTSLRGAGVTERNAQRVVDELLNFNAPPTCQLEQGIRAYQNQERLFVVICDQGALVRAIRQRRENLEKARAWVSAACDEGGA